LRLDTDSANGHCSRGGDLLQGESASFRGPGMDNNPITIPPLYYFAYEVGLWFLNQPSNADESEFSISNILSNLGDVWQPFLIGCFIMGIVSSAAGYFGIQYYWQQHVMKKWEERKAARVKAKKPRRTEKGRAKITSYPRDFMFFP
jgi:uncharacterized protein (DUF2062 family)